MGVQDGRKQQRRESLLKQQPHGTVRCGREDVAIRNDILHQVVNGGCRSLGYSEGTKRQRAAERLCVLIH